MPFATAEDVGIRLGRDLDAAEQAMVEMVIEQVTGLIIEAVCRDDDWAADLAPVPSTLKLLCIEKALAVGSNPNGVASESEQLGAYQSSRTFRRSNGSADVFLTDAEERRVRRAVYGTNADSPRMGSIIDDIEPAEVIEDTIA